MTEAQTLRLKRRFLEHFRELGNVTAAARAAKMAHRETVYGWLERDEKFAAAYRAAEVESIEVLEEEARRRAVVGVTHETPIFHNGRHLHTVIETKYSDTLLIFLLKARKPEKYRENRSVEVSGPSGGPIPVRAFDYGAAVASIAGGPEEDR